MADTRICYGALPDVSGCTDSGPKVLKYLQEYDHNPQLKWDTRESCINLAKSEELYSESRKANTLLCIQSCTLPFLASQKRLDLMACFLHCVDDRVRTRTLSNLEVVLYDIKDYSETFGLLKDTEDVLFAVMQSYLNRWRVLSKENEQFYLNILRLYCLVIGTLACVTLSSDDHVRFEDLIKAIGSRGLLRFNKKQNKGLAALEEPLKMYSQYLKLKLRRYQKILTAVESTESIESLRLSKEAPEVQFTALYFILQKLFQSPTPAHLETFQKCVAAVLKSRSENLLLMDLITHGIVNFLLQYLIEGKLPSKEVVKFSTEMIELLPAKTMRNLGTIDVLMFVKNAPARSQMIEIFLGHKLYTYETDIVKTNVKMIEMLLSATTPQFKNPEHHPYTKEWRQCAGTFGKRAVLLNVYIPDYKTHKDDIYITDDSIKGQEPFNEITLLRKLPSHRNLIQVYAFSLAKLPYFYITENHLHGNLQLELKNKSINMDTFTPRQLLTFVVDAINAVDFLHSNNIIHRDLTASSFCLDEEREHIKLANLCLANRQDSSERMKREKSSCLPTRWLAPESFTDLIFSTASDVWMFGCFMYEVLTHGCLPHSDIIAGEEKIMKLVTEGRKNLCQENCIRPDLSKIITDCTQKVPEERPCAQNIRGQLEEVLCSSVDEQYETDTVFPGLWNERIPSAEMNRGISFDDKKNEVPLYENMENHKGKTDVEARDDEALTGDEDDPYAHAFEQIQFPDTEAISDKTSPLHVFELQKQRLTGIPQFSVNRKGNREEIVFDQMEEAVPLSWSKNQPTQYGMLHTLLAVANTISALHEENWIHGNLGTECIWTVHGYDSPKIIFSRIQFMTHLKPSEHSVRVRRDAADIDKRSAPELKKNGKLSKASDVFSFGFVMWDIAQAIYGNGDVQSHTKLPTGEELYSHFVTALGEILPPPDNCPSQLYTIIKSCWHSEPSQRPTIAHVAQDISHFMSLSSEDDGGYEDLQNKSLSSEDDGGYETVPNKACSFYRNFKNDDDGIHSSTEGIYKQGGKNVEGFDEYEAHCSAEEISNDFECNDNNKRATSGPTSLPPGIYVNVQQERSTDYTPPLPERRHQNEEQKRNDDDGIHSSFEGIYEEGSENEEGSTDYAPPLPERRHQNEEQKRNDDDGIHSSVEGIYEEGSENEEGSTDYAPPLPERIYQNEEQKRFEKRPLPPVPRKTFKVVKEK